MKKFLIALGTAAILGASSAHGAISFQFSPATNHIEIGESLVINARVSGLDSEVLSAFDLNFKYNSSILNWTLAEYFGMHLGNSLGLSNNGLPNGDLGFDNSSLDSDTVLAGAQADEFLLFRLTFTGTADGVTDFTLGLDPDFERNFVGLNFQTLDVAVGSACISVGTGACNQQVPEPASLALIGLALAGAFASSSARRRRVTDQTC